MQFQGLPARIGWLGHGERSRLALAVNAAVARGAISAPIAFTRDHLDAGSVAIPFRETEKMRDGSDAIADWPILNALLACATGADLVAVHANGGRRQRRADRDRRRHAARPRSGCSAVLDADTGIGIVRHADAGYEEAVRACASARGRARTAARMSASSARASSKRRFSAACCCPAAAAVCVVGAPSRARRGQRSRAA